MNNSSKVDSFFSKKNKPIVLFLVAEAKYFLSHRLSLAQSAKEEGYDVIVATKDSSKLGFLQDRFRVIEIPFNRSIGGIQEELRTLATLSECIRKNRPAIVHAVSLKISILAALCVWRVRDSVLLCAFTGLGHLFTSSKVSTKLLRFIVQLTLRLLLSNKNYWSVVQNKEDLELIQRVRGGDNTRLLMIPGSGVNTDFFPYSKIPKDKACRVLFPARLLIDKGIQEFVLAARSIMSRRSDVEFVIAGGLDPTNPSAICQSEVESWIEEGIIEWMGEVQDMRPLYQGSTIVCLPSYREGLPKSLLEAASSGRPLVATDVPGCREICRSGENGLLVPAKDSITLASTLETLLDDLKLCEGLGEQGRKIVESEFSEREINNVFLKLYKRMNVD